MYRLGRAIAESGRTAALAPVLRRLAVDPTLDTLNRTRALMVLSYALGHDPDGKRESFDSSLTRPIASVSSVLRNSPLPAAARAWLDQQ